MFVEVEDDSGLDGHEIGAQTLPSWGCNFESRLPLSSTSTHSVDYSVKVLKERTSKAYR